MKPPIPTNEAERLRALQLYQILDTAADTMLDDLTGLAAAICETPISLISLVDEKRQWFKSRVGLTASETSRETAFCAYTILGDDLMIVEDATKDHRFAQNPLVTAEPNIRFYAGAPLIVSEGVALGTLCVIDREPRTLTTQQKDTLKILRHAIVTQLELRRAEHALLAVERLLPMCAWCRSIRAEDGSWNSPDEYLVKSVPITHGACPDCAASISP